MHVEGIEDKDFKTYLLNRLSLFINTFFLIVTFELFVDFCLFLFQMFFIIQEISLETLEFLLILNQQ